MPLIDFRTNLTSLRYGKDRPGGGDSGQPYIKFPIEGQPTPDILQTYYDINRTNLDFPVRGGAISDLLNSTVAGAIDRDRIQKFFNDAPRGTTFIAKQTGLQLSNPRTQVPQALAFLGGTIGNAVIPVTQTYDPINTLAQVRVQGTGLHFNRHGLAPNIYENVRQTYEYYAGDPDNNTSTTNRLAILRALKLIGDTGFTLDKNISSGVGIDPSLVDRLGISVLQNQIYNYPGGPGSVYGVGTTTVERVTDTNQVGLAYSNMALTYNKLAQQKTIEFENVRYPIVQDFRNQLGNSEMARSDYATYSTEALLGVGKPGGQWLSGSSPSNYSISKQGAVDTVNMRSEFYFNSDTTTPWFAGEDSGMSTADMIKFTFECMDNDSPGKAMGLVFRAFFDGQITDNHTAEYNTFKYLGRGETFRTYQGFNRTINFSFKIAAQTRDEMRPLYKKLNHLISQVYPDYSPKTNTMRGNVVKLTIGDYVYRMPGFIENVNVTIDNNNTPWEILLGEKDEGDLRQLPHFVTVSCTFYPILDILPRREKGLDNDVQLIVNDDVKKPPPDPAPATPIDTSTTPQLPTGITVRNVPSIPNPPVKQPSPTPSPTKGQTRRRTKKPPQTTTPPPPPSFNFVEREPPRRDNTRIAAPGLNSGMGTAGGF